MHSGKILFVALTAIALASAGSIKSADAGDGIRCPHDARHRCADRYYDPSRFPPKPRASVAVPGGGATMKTRR